MMACFNKEFNSFSTDDDSGEKSVNVLLGGEESELTFIDHSYSDMTVSEHMIDTNKVSEISPLSSNAARELHVVVRSAWLSGDLLERRQELIHTERNDTAELVEERKYCAESCNTRWQ